MSVTSRFLNLFRSRALQHELDAEVQFHLELLIGRNLRDGMSRAEAEKDARRRFGNVGRITEDMREVRAMTWLESMLQDLRYGVRAFGRERLSTGAVVAMLALGVGANVAIFTLLNAVWLRPLPYRDAGRLVVLEDSFTRLSIRNTSPTVPEFLDVRSWNRSFEMMAFLDHRDLQLTGGQEPARVFGGRVTAAFFPLLGAEAALGRVFNDSDNRPGNEKVAVLTDGLWRRAFAADPAIIGRELMLDGRPHQVVGVLSAAFSFDHPEIGVGEPSEVYVPFLLNDYYTLRSGGHSHLRRVLALAKLQPGIGIATANAELGLLAERLATEHPDLYRSRPSGEAMGFTMQVRPLRDAIAGESRAVLWLLFAAVGMVLLIACVNTAQFLLARSLQRQEEVAIRLALGATRQRLVQQFLTEALLLAAAGGMLGFWIAQIFVRALVSLNPASTPLLSSARADATVLAFTLGLATLTAILFGLLPALAGSGPARQRLLFRGPRAWNQSRYALVALEVALSMVLLASAAVLLRGLLHMSNAPRGYSPDDVTVMQLRLTQPRREAQANPSVQYEQYLARIREIPGVDAAAVLGGQAVPLTDVDFVIDAHAGDANALARQTSRSIVSPDYFRALRIPLVQGRTFTAADTPDRPAVVIVNQALAERLWPNDGAVGKQLRLPRPTTIVGVVGSTRMRSMATDMAPQIYVPSLQVWEPNASIVVRTVAGTEAPIQAIKQAVWSVDPQQAVFNIRSLRQMLSRSVAEPRFRTWLLGCFAALALVLSAAGIFGLVSYLVSRRTREIAIRMAVGARPRDVYWIISRQTLASVCTGLVAGLAGAVAANRALSSGLQGIGPLDVPTLAAVSVAYLVIALAATYIPARRAFGLDAMRALKSD
jgi:predicted permease